MVVRHHNNVPSLASWWCEPHPLAEKLYTPKWEKSYLLTCASNEDSDQPAHPRSLIWVFIVRMKIPCIHDYPKCVKWRFWSNCGNAQADLNLWWAYMSKVRFPPLRFICLAARRHYSIIAVNFHFVGIRRKCLCPSWFPTLLKLTPVSLGILTFLFHVLQRPALPKVCK